MGIIVEDWISDQGVHLTVQRASGFARLRGLIARRQLPPGRALLIANCAAVHGVGMTRKIDLVFVDHVGRVVLVRPLAPFCFARSAAATHVLELAAGEAARLGLRRGSSLTAGLEQNEEGWFGADEAC